MSVHYLNAEDFGLEQGHLVTNVPGLLFVMFTSKKCKYCDDFMPEFKSLPNAIVGVNFGICNVDDANRRVLSLSVNSSTPIKGVPKFVLYQEGMPYVEYTGARTAQAVLNFMKEIFAKLNQKRQFDQPQRSRIGASGSGPMPAQGHGSPQGGLPPRGAGGMGVGGVQGQHQQQGPPQQGFKINPSTQVKEFETSYGRPYNVGNDQEFLAYENAYLNK